MLLLEIFVDWLVEPIVGFFCGLWAAEKVERQKAKMRSEKAFSASLSNDYQI